MGAAIRVLTALSIVLGVIGGYHWLIIDRLVLAPQWSQGLQTAMLGFTIAGAISMPLAMTGERFFDVKRLRALLIWPAMLWMGASFMLFSAVVVTDVLYALLPLELPSFAKQRALAVFALVGILTGIGVRSALVPKTKRVEVAIHNWPSALDGLRIVQLSDIHIGPILTSKHAAYLTERANELNPDLVVVTGDLVDGSAEHLAPEVAPFGQLDARLGGYFVTGNHDFYSGANSWCDVVEALGLQVLRNRHVVISDQGASFALAGVDDHRGDPIRGSGSGEDLHAALDDIPDGLATVLLAHDPATYKAASRMGVDLQISGHTHGGQIWPFRYAVRMTTKWVAGLYREGRSQIYVSRGTGFWGPPIRVGAPAEITEITLRRA